MSKDRTPRSRHGGRRLHPLPIRFMHWINAAAMLVMITSGWGIYDDDVIIRGLHFSGSLRLGDWAAWSQCWQELDATACAALLRALQAGHRVRLTLCGERSALTFERGRAGLIRKLMSQFGRKPLSSLRDIL